VPKARGGEKLRIGDGATNWGASPVTVKGGQMADLRTILVDGLQVPTTDAGAAAIEKLTKALADSEAKLSAAELKAAKEKADLEAEMAKKDAAIAKADADKLTDAALDKLVADRAELLAKVALITKGFNPSGLSDAAIRKAAVVAVLGDAVIAGKSDAYIDARFDILADSDILDGVKVVSKSADSLDAFYAERDKKMSDAWKGAV
jgi:hypothetical protein